MSKTSEHYYDIEQLYIDGVSGRSIAEILDISFEEVSQVLADMSVADTQQDEDEIYSPYYGA